MGNRASKKRNPTQFLKFFGNKNISVILHRISSGDYLIFMFTMLIQLYKYQFKNRTWQLQGSLWHVPAQE